jgi:hypothetical protein
MSGTRLIIACILMVICFGTICCGEDGNPCLRMKDHIVCDMVCVDPLTDDNNCGKCGNACASGESCTDGVCLEDDSRQCNDVGGAGECMWDDDCPVDYVCAPSCACMPREGLEGCECIGDGDCETPHHCIMCKCQDDFPWCAMNSCLSDEQCSAEGEICVGVGGECAMDERYDYCYCICNP